MPDLVMKSKRMSKWSQWNLRRHKTSNWWYILRNNNPELYLTLQNCHNLVHSVLSMFQIIKLVCTQIWRKSF